MIRKSLSKNPVAPALLFDRLVDEHPQISEETVCFRTVNKQEYIDSIAKELDQLLNTRCNLHWKPYRRMMHALKGHAAPELYGLPDFSHFDGAKKTSWEDIQQTIKHIIEIYEPRLSFPEVKIDTYDRQEQTLNTHIRGTIIYNDVQEQISFPTQISTPNLSNLSSSNA